MGDDESVWKLWTASGCHVPSRIATKATKSATQFQVTRTVPTVIGSHHVWTVNVKLEWKKRGEIKKGKKSQLHYSFIVQSGDGGVSRPFICDLKCCASFDILVFWKLFSQILIHFLCGL